MSYTEGELHSKQIRDSINSLLETVGSDEIGKLIESLEGKDFATQQELEEMKSKLIEFKQQAFSTLLIQGENKEVYNQVSLLRPGWVEGAEITVTAASSVDIVLNTNDKFDISRGGGLPAEVQIAAGTYETGIVFVDAIITAIENAGVDNWTTVEWLGNDDGNIRFTADEGGVINEIMISEPNEHSALVEMGFNDPTAVTNFPADISREDVIDKVNDLEVLINDVTEPIGEEGNAWNNEATGANGDSNTVDTQFTTTVDIAGEVSGATDITLYKSQDGTKFYNSGIVIEITEAEDFAVNNLPVGFRYLRLQSSNNITATATIAAKM